MNPKDFSTTYRILVFNLVLILVSKIICVIRIKHLNSDGVYDKIRLNYLPLHYTIAIQEFSPDRYIKIKFFFRKLSSTLHSVLMRRIEIYKNMCWPMKYFVIIGWSLRLRLKVHNLHITPSFTIATNYLFSLDI